MSVTIEEISQFVTIDESSQLVEVSEASSVIVVDGTLQGAQGLPGVDGLDGVDGVDGVDGQDGAPGVDGLPGADGADGQDGVQAVSNSLTFEDVSYIYNSFLQSADWRATRWSKSTESLDGTATVANNPLQVTQPTDLTTLQSLIFI